jgi:hypothetical protein
MKKIYISLVALVSISFAGNMLKAQGEIERDTLTMEQGYTNDVFYSFATGEVSSIGRDDWEIAFYTSAFSTGIITNGGVGIRLYAYPNGDTSDWANIDTTGFASWEPLYNSPTNWEEGAFNHHILGHPDYGWGIYDPLSHHIVGDSLFIIDLPSSGLKKLWIIEKDPVLNIYSFRYAKMDGTDEHEVEYDISPYTNKRFAYYSLTDNMASDREPISERWDILFTRYVDWVPDNEGNLSPYIVTGVLNNVDIASNEFYPVGPDFMDWQSTPMDSVINHIGYDWKVLLPDFTYEIKDSNYYFVRNYDGNVYKLWFNWWAGSSSGDFALDKQFITTVSVNEIAKKQESFQIYPNPASGSFNIHVPSNLNGSVQLQIFDQSGRLVYQQSYSDISANQTIRVSNFNLSVGFYFVTLSANDYSDSQKLIVR